MLLKFALGFALEFALAAKTFWVAKISGLQNIVGAFTSVKPPRAFSNQESKGHNKCDKTVTDKRPVNLDLGSIEYPLPAIASILHRISGGFLVIGVGVLLWMLDASLASEAGFNEIKQISDSVICKLVVWIVLAGLIYHTVAGVKHLIMDLGYGESLEGGMIAAKSAVGVSVVLIVMVGAWIW
jgi:succinate dehydrogenase cytochrome b subunit